MYNDFENEKIYVDNLDPQSSETVIKDEPSPNSPKPPKKKKLNSFIAIVLAIAIVGGASGFGGAYLSNSLLSSGTSGVSSSDEQSNTSSTKTESQVNIDDLQSEVQSTVNADNVIEKNSDGTYKSVADLVESVQRSVVQIENYITSMGKETLYGTGSGVIVSTDGYIITNAHVVESASSLKVYIQKADSDTANTSATVDSDNTAKTDNSDQYDEYDATLVGSDSSTDLAVLKIVGNDFPAAVLGDSDTLRLGDDVIAIGNPEGLVGTVTKGIISGLDRFYETTDNRTLSSIQTDAAINFGNSGGALFDMSGTVVGIVNAKIVAEGADNLGFAITINEAKPIIQDLLSNGYVSGRAILGITCMQVSEYLAMLQGMTPGLYVTEISTDAAVAESGLKLGDIITAIDGTAVTSVTEVSNILSDKNPGDTVTASVIRTDSLGNEKEISIVITLSEYKGS